VSHSVRTLVASKHLVEGSTPSGRADCWLEPHRRSQRVSVAAVVGCRVSLRSDSGAQHQLMTGEHLGWRYSCTWELTILM